MLFTQPPEGGECYLLISICRPTSGVWTWSWNTIFWQRVSRSK